MYYVVTRIMTFAGVLYHPGDVLDLADVELATQMLRETGSAAELIDNAVLPKMVKPAAKPVIPDEIAVESEPESELELESEPIMPSMKRRRKSKAG